MILPHRNFTGEFPRLKARNLPPNAAQVSIDCDFTRGTLTGIRNPRTVMSGLSTSPKSIFIYDDTAATNYFSWTGDVDAVRGPITDDLYKRFYWADGTNFYVSLGSELRTGGEPTQKWKVGVPKPSAAPTRADEQQFKIPGFGSFGDASWSSLYAVVLAKENANGDVLEEQSVTMSIIDQTEEMVYLGGSYTLAFTPITKVTNTVTETTVTNPDNSTSVVSTPVEQTTYEAVTPVVKLWMRSDTGMSVCAILRPGQVDNSWPPEAFGFGADFAFTGSTLNVRIYSTPAYKQERAYVYTYVNDWGEEGPPSETFTNSMVDGQIFKILYTPYVTSGLDYRSISKVRFYRTNVSGTFCFLAEVDHTNFSPAERNHVVDGIITANLVEPLSSQGCFPPPQDLIGICAMPNGILAGFQKNGTKVMFSEPYLPYAWNPDNAQQSDKSIVGLCPYETSLYVTTKANPFLVNGVQPESMTMQKIPAIQAGVSKGSICNAGPYVVYASNDGLVVMRGLDAATTLSENFFTRNVWRDLYKAKLNLMRISAHDGHVLVWFTDGTPGFLIKLDENQPSLTQITDQITCAYVHPDADALYYGYGTTIYEFKGGTTSRAFVWHSRDNVVPSPHNFGAAQLFGTGSVTIKTYAGGVLKDTTTVTLDKTGMTIFRLPSGFLSSTWSFDVEGAAGCEIEEFNVATSIREFSGV